MKEKKEINNENLIGYQNEETERFKLKNFYEEEKKKSKAELMKILKNLERDLIIKSEVDKEFDLKKDDDSFFGTEIIGSPSCHICTISNKMDSSIKLFYCSHCEKIFCRNCLEVHYNSDFKSIGDSLTKNLSEENNNYINKIIPKEIGCCKFFLLIILIVPFNFVYLLPIFAMKPISSTLEIIIVNCIKEIFTHRIEEPNSLFNFYEIFFNKLNTLNINFNLIMIMNWLGDRILISCGFTITTFIFIAINSLHFVLLFNFDFLDFNENNKYGFWKFMHLVLCYLLLFIGAGGSSLLSQKIFMELYQKFGDNEKNSFSPKNRTSIF